MSSTGYGRLKIENAVGLYFVVVVGAVVAKAHSREGDDGEICALHIEIRERGARDGLRIDPTGLDAVLAARRRHGRHWQIAQQQRRTGGHVERARHPIQPDYHVHHELQVSAQQATGYLNPPTPGEYNLTDDNMVIWVCRKTASKNLPDPDLDSEILHRNNCKTYQHQNLND